MQTENISANFNQVLKVNGRSMEGNFLNQTVCVLDSFEIHCHNTSHLPQKWQLPIPDLLPSIKCKLKFTLDK